MPILTVLVLGEGFLRVVTLYLSRRENREQWEEIMVASLEGHTVICGTGELGRALLHQLLRQDEHQRIVVVDTNQSILQEMGIHLD